MTIIEKLGRRIRLGVVGGGGAALIGPVHRAAARLDDLIEITAGVLSSNAERSVAEARRLMIPRGYADLGAMLAGEGEKLDAVAVMTPNDSHGPLSLQALAAGRHVICDKPLTNDLAEAKALVAAVRRSGLVFGLTHNYSGYPMIRQARAMVQAGASDLHLTSGAAPTIRVSGSLVPLEGFTALAPGTYVVKFELTSFQNVVVEGVVVNASSTMTVNAPMQLSSLAEAVTVISTTPTIDLQSTRTIRFTRRPVVSSYSRV